MALSNYKNGMANLSDEEASVRGQAQVWQHMFAFADSMALKCAIELRIADIIHSQGKPLTLSQIAASFNSPSPNLEYLERIMRLLVRRKVFSAERSHGGETLYGLTNVSKWILHDAENTLAPMFLMENLPLKVNAWHYFSDCVKNGGVTFEKSTGHEFWDFAKKDSDYNKIFSSAMSCSSKVASKAVLDGFKDGFRSIKSLVDVGGRYGALISEIVKANPHIKGINFDQPHVVDAAPNYDGVTHVGGDMFQSIPNADAVIIKWVLHDWGDEDCVKILKNCRKAIPEKTGKLIIVDIILKPDGDGLFDDSGVAFDLVLLASLEKGKERTEDNWRKLLKEAGFPRYKIIPIPALPNIIEAYPQ